MSYTDELSTERGLARFFATIDQSLEEYARNILHIVPPHLWRNSDPDDKRAIVIVVAVVNGTHQKHWPGIVRGGRAQMITDMLRQKQLIYPCRDDEIVPVLATRLWALATGRVCPEIG